MVSRWESRTNANVALLWYLRGKSREEVVETWKLNHRDYLRPLVGEWNTGPLGSQNFRPTAEAIKRNDSFFDELAGVYRREGLLGREFSQTYGATVVLAFMAHHKEWPSTNTDWFLRSIWSLLTLMAMPVSGSYWQTTTPAGDEAGRCDDRYRGAEVVPVGERATPWTVRGALPLSMLLSAALDHERSFARQDRLVPLPIAPPDDPRDGTLVLEDGTTTTVRDWNDGPWVLATLELLTGRRFEDKAPSHLFGLSGADRTILRNALLGERASVEAVVDWMKRDDVRLWSDLEIERHPTEVVAFYRAPSNGNKPPVQYGSIDDQGFIETAIIEPWSKKSGAVGSQLVIDLDPDLNGRRLRLIHPGGETLSIDLPDADSVVWSVIVNDHGTFFLPVDEEPPEEPSDPTPVPPPERDRDGSGCGPFVFVVLFVAIAALAIMLGLPTPPI